MSRILLSLILLTAPISQKMGETDAEIEIRLLIHAVRESRCDFDRNGKLYEVGRAAQHLELKCAQGKRYADSAEAFIERLATGSSWSGEPYWMFCDGDKISTAEWLTAQLEGARAQQALPGRWIS